MIAKINIQGQTVLFYDTRCIENPDSKKFYYDCRHSEDDWVTPCTIEPHVVVNFAGMVECKKPLVFEDDYIEIDEEDIEWI